MDVKYTKVLRRCRKSNLISTLHNLIKLKKDKIIFSSSNQIERYSNG